MSNRSVDIFAPILSLRPRYTGFKYIENTALDLVNQGYDVPFGYEEAIGYMFGSQIRDKDGIAATVYHSARRPWALF